MTKLPIKLEQLNKIVENSITLDTFSESPVVVEADVSAKRMSRSVVALQTPHDNSIFPILTVCPPVIITSWAV